MQNNYSIIIVGGGPVGTALAIELGLQGIKTLALEKYDEPLLSPRAQFLNVRSVDIFKRWGIAKELRDKKLLDENFPQRTAWQDTLNSKPYVVTNIKSAGLRIPLYITETIMRKRLKEIPDVTFLKNTKVKAVNFSSEQVFVTAEYQSKEKVFSADYVIACDGANSLVRQQAKIHFDGLAPKRQILSVLFQAPDLYDQLDDVYMLHFCLNSQGTTAIGPIDPNKGIWYAQIPYEKASLPSVNKTSELLENIIGFKIKQTILKHHLWNMQIQLAERFSHHQRLFLVGDSAHAFAPNGGLGLNTGLVDAVNIGWKLAGVIKKIHVKEILETYESERRPVAIRNLCAAEQNAQNVIAAKDNQARLAETSNNHTNADGLTRGYAYLFSNLTVLERAQSLMLMNNNDYQPIAQPGYFVPEIYVKGKSIYEILSPVFWTLLVVGKLVLSAKLPKCVKVLFLPEGSYQSSYLLLRPDWHISAVYDVLPSELRLPLSM